MKVYKFGGASVKDEWGIRNLSDIVKEVEGRLVIVVSALGKTTNSLESMLQKLHQEDGDYEGVFEDIRSYHFDLATNLFGSDEAELLLGHMFNDTRLIIDRLEGQEYDYCYDQLVSQGELWSTRIVNHWLKRAGLDSEWIDIRSKLITDTKFREANVDWNETSKRLSEVFTGGSSRVYVTQGFIGGTSGGDTTTLGREGSDYTAAIIANICDASTVTIWKDVPGVLNVDPKWMEDANRLENISYKEAVEMSFSGAKVIHPKTIKPLHNKSIPLYIKSFLDPLEKGTVVSRNESIEQEVPVYVRKQDQVLISFVPKDLSFAIGENLGPLFQIFSTCGIKTNLVQASAVSVAVCVDNDQSKITELINSLSPDYKILVNDGVEMLTLRYYTEAAINKLTGNHEILIEQRTRKSIRYVVK